MPPDLRLFVDPSLLTQLEIIALLSLFSFGLQRRILRSRGSLCWVAPRIPCYHP